MTPPLFLDPVFKEKIWGGHEIEARFGYSDVPPGPIGECWGISAHPNGPSTVRNGPHAGLTLPEVWDRDRAFFGGDDRDVFPMLVKFLDARDWLSVQVHPDDAQARRLEGEPLGKTECWYVLAADPGAELILGHSARSRDELVLMVESGQWDRLLDRRPVRTGDFVYVPSGTLHAIGPGVVVCEVQQSSDTTYRVYDFDRRDDAGNMRSLHLRQAEAVTTVPYDPVTTQTGGGVVAVPGGERRTLVDGPFFTATKHMVEGDGYVATFPSYELCSVIGGSGDVACGDARYELVAGDHFILPAGAGAVTFGTSGTSGGMSLISAHPAPDRGD